MKTITITAAEEKIILNALHSRKVDATHKAKYMGTTATLKEKLLNIAIDAAALHIKIINSGAKGRNAETVGAYNTRNTKL